jgi:hypothetical protein
VSTAAGFYVDTFNVDNSDSVTGDDTSLVKVKAVLLLCGFLVFEVLGDFVPFENDFVGFVFNFHLLFLGD